MALPTIHLPLVIPAENGVQKMKWAAGKGRRETLRDNGEYGEYGSWDEDLVIGIKGPALQSSVLSSK